MQKVGYILVKGMMTVFGVLPLKVHYFLGRFLSWIIGGVVRYRRSVARDNLKHAFPEKTQDELRHIEKRFYRHFGELLAETVWFGAHHSVDNFRKLRVVELVNPEESARLYENSPSVMILGSHQCNWELIGSLPFANFGECDSHIDETRMSVVYRRLSSGVWDRILKENRFSLLCNRKECDGYVESANVMRSIYNRKGEKWFYFLISDQRPYFAAPSYIEVEFMHRKVQTMSGAAAVARKFGMSIAFLSMRRKSRGHYECEIKTICDNAALMSVQQIMDKYYELLQKDIEAQPCQYLWTHRRWLII